MYRFAVYDYAAFGLLHRMFLFDFSFNVLVRTCFVALADHDACGDAVMR